MSHFVRFAALAAVAWACSHAAIAGTLNDTGQVACFDVSSTSTGTVASGTPAPESTGFEGQDCSLGAAAADAVGAQVKIGGSSVAGRDYSKIGNDGSVLPDTAVRGSGATDWACTRDNVTGLIWQLRNNDGGVGDQDHRYAFGSNSPFMDEDTCESESTPCNTDQLVQAINAAGLCGASDWTLPTPAQLESLLAYADPGSTANLIDQTWFPDQANDGVNQFHFWSGDLADTGATTAWVADFDFGWTTVSSLDSAHYVRLVRAAPAAVTPRFSTSEPGTAGEVVVTDAETGLMWKQCPQGLSGSGCATGTLGTLDWSGALVAAAGESFAGHDDWRLPTIIELASIRDYTPVTFPTVPLSAEFAGTAATDTYWSSTNDPRPTSLDSALAYQYNDSTAHNTLFKNQSLAVRLVRGGHFLGAHAPGADTVPDAFSLPAKQAGAAQLVGSADITVTGLGSGAVASMSVTGAAESALSTDGGSKWTSLAAAVRNGDSVRVRHRAAATAGATATTTLTIGGVTADFVSTAFGAPGAPTNISAVAGNSQATISFDAPASDGGATVTGYQATSAPGAFTGDCSASPCTVTGLANGTSYTFTVTASNGLTGPASIASNAVVPQAPQAIVFGSAPTVVVGGTGSLQATGGASGNPVTFSSTTPAVCSVSGSTVTGEGVGTCTVAANQAGNAAFIAAAEVTQDFTVGQGTQVIQFAALADRLLTQSPLTLSATGGGSGNPVLFASTTTATCTTSGNNGATLTLLDYGTCTVEASQTGSANYLAAAAVARSFQIVSEPLAIEFVGEPRATFSVSHNFYSLHFLGADHRLRIRSPAPLAQVTASADDSRVSVFVAPHAAEAGEFTIGADVVLTQQPESDVTATVTYTASVTGPAGAETASVSVPVTFSGNRPPTATYSTKTVRLPSGAALGGYTVPGFVVAEDPGSPSEIGQTVQHRLFDYTPYPFLDDYPEISDMAVAGGTLSFVYGGISCGGFGCAGGSLTVHVMPEDDGAGSTCESAGITDYETRCGLESRSYLTVVVGETSLLGVDASRASTSAGRAKAAASSASIRYRIEAANLGSLPLDGARVRAAIPAQLSAVSWTCSVPVGSCTPASGTGAVDTRVDLGLDEAAEIIVDATLDPDAAYVDFRAQGELPDGVQGAVFQPRGYLIDPVSSAFIFVGKFEGAGTAVSSAP